MKIFTNTNFLAIIACLLWSTAFVGIKIGLKYTTPIQFAGIRFFISGLMILLVIKDFKSYFAQIKRNVGVVIIVSVLQTFMQYFFFYMGINKVSGALGAIVIGAGPLFVAIVSHFFMSNDKITLKKLGAILLGFSGILLVILGRGTVFDTDTGFLWGVIFLVLCNINSGFSNVFIAKKTKHIHSLTLSSSSLIFGGLLLMLVSIPLEGAKYIGITAAEYYIALLWLSFLSAAAISIWTTLLKRPKVKVSDLNMWKFIVPVFGAILSWVILSNESPNLLSILGMLLTASSLLLVNYFNRKKNAAKI